MLERIPRGRPILAVAAVIFLGVAYATPGQSPDTARDARDRLAIPPTDDGLPGAGPIRRYDWFQKLWRERRSAWAKEVEQDQGAVVFLGDSITQGWGGGLGAAFPGIKVANRGISGDTTRGVLIRLREDVLVLNPSAVVLLIGTNDLDEGATPDVIAGNLKLILAAFKQHNARMPIVLCQVFPSSARMKRPAGQIKTINALYQAAVRNDAQVTLVETWPLFADASGDAIPAEFPDLLHPNEAGYAKWAAALRPIFATLGLSEVEDPFILEDGFESLFNGRDLTGWGYRPTSEADRASAARWQASDPNAAAWPFLDAPVDFDGQEATPDGRFVVKGGRLVVTTPPEYRKIQQLWTKREFSQDFVLKLEFRATPNADSGVYVRGPQLQCRDYSLAGPYKTLKNYRPQDWNEIVVTVKDGVARATSNGEILEAEMKLPASGPIGLEGDRGQMEYRRIRIKLLPQRVAADRWTEFRGPSGTGHSDSSGLPRDWSETRNVAWKTRIHGRGWSSPVVLGKQVWLTTATPEGKELFVVALDRDDGRVLFDQKVFDVERPEDTRRYNSFASPTPVIEDGRVYVHFGSYGTAALATDTGKVLWTRRDLPCNHWRGPGSSPILYGDLLIVHFDGYDYQYVVALDKRTGRTVWKTDRTHDFETDDGDQKKGFATPVVIEAAGRPQLISPAAKAVVSLDPLTGRERWRVRYEQHSAAARPLFAGGLVYVDTGYGKASLLAIRPDGQGDVTGSHVAWSALKGIGAKPSPLLVDDLIYAVADTGGVVTCIDAKTGGEVWQQRVGGGGHSGSPLFGDRALYFFAEDGSAVVLEPGRAYKELGRGRLDEGGVMATPAIAGRAIFVRTESHLYRLEKRP